MNSDIEEKQKIASFQVKKKQGIKLQVCSAIMAGWTLTSVRYYFLIKISDCAKKHHFCEYVYI